MFKRFNDGGVSVKPWTLMNNDMSITLPACEVKGWAVERHTQIIRCLNPPKEGNLVDCDCAFMPLIPKKENLSVKTVRISSRCRIAQQGLELQFFLIAETKTKKFHLYIISLICHEHIP